MNNMLIDNIVSECVDMAITREKVKNVIREELDRYYGYLTEKTKKKKKENKKDKKKQKTAADQRRNAVMNMLKDGRFLHSYLSYKLWHPKDQSEKDTCRSLFSKMANGTPDADGNIRQFTDKEITKLYNIMHTKK